MLKSAECRTDKHPKWLRRPGWPDVSIWLQWRDQEAVFRVSLKNELWSKQIAGSGLDQILSKPILHDRLRIIHHKFIPSDSTVTKRYYQEVFGGLRESVRCKRLKPWCNKSEFSTMTVHWPTSHYVYIAARILNVCLALQPVCMKFSTDFHRVSHRFRLQSLIIYITVCQNYVVKIQNIS